MKIINRFTVAALLISTATSLSAQLSLSDRMYMRMERSGTANSRSAEDSETTLVFIKLAQGATRSDLEAEGVNVSTVRGDIALAAVATTDLDRVASLPCVERLEVSRRVRHTMDCARAASGVDKMQQGYQLDQPYTGKGVIAAVVDEGLDANHANFRNEDGTSRIAFLSQIWIDSKAQGGWDGMTYDRDNIFRFTTDSKNTFHATHTLGILGGSYKGKINAAIENDDNTTATIKEIDNPYYGVATGADLVAGTTVLMDQLIAESIDMMLNYRYSTKQPMVLSISLGSNINSHSPKALMNQFLDLAAKETLIVMSAGNEGDIPLALTKNLTENDKEAKTFIQSLITEPMHTSSGQVIPAGYLYGMCHIFSDKPFKLTALTYNKTRNRIAYRMVPDEDAELGTGKWFASSEDYRQESTDIISSQLNTAFSGFVGIGYDIDQYSQEYMGLVSYGLVPNNDNYIFGFLVEGEPGQRIECYNEIDYSQLSNFDIAGWDNGSCDGSISDMACGENVLVVGAYNTRDSYGSLDGYRRHYQGKFEPGKITPVSSYGTLASGRTLPHVCAPGAAIISSTNSYYEEADGAENVNLAALTARLDESGRRNYWTPASGTSMATPYVAGSIACWLEADPTLTIDDVKDIITTTAIRDEDVVSGNPVQWGAGKFDAYAGLKEVLRRTSGISNVSSDSNSLMIKGNGRMFELFLAGADKIDAKVYNMAGSLSLTANTSGDTAHIDAATLSPGVYIVNVNGQHKGKIVVH